MRSKNYNSQITKGRHIATWCAMLVSLGTVAILQTRTALAETFIEEDFESYTVGSTINGVGNWRAQTPSKATVQTPVAALGSKVLDLESQAGFTLYNFSAAGSPLTPPSVTETFDTYFGSGTLATGYLVLGFVTHSSPDPFAFAENTGLLFGFTGAGQVSHQDRNHPGPVVQYQIDLDGDGTVEASDVLSEETWYQFRTSFYLDNPGATDYYTFEWRPRGSGTWTMAKNDRGDSTQLTLDDEGGFGGTFNNFGGLAFRMLGADADKHIFVDNFIPEPSCLTVVGLAMLMFRFRRR